METKKKAEHKQYTRTEVKGMNGNGKTVIILHDKVYDVTPFLNEHPGGEEILLDRGGTDASEDFDDIGHSKDAFEIQRNYLIGELVESERRNVPPKAGWVAGYNKSANNKDDQTSSMALYVLISAIITVAFALIVINS